MGLLKDVAGAVAGGMTGGAAGALEGAAGMPVGRKKKRTDASVDTVGGADDNPDDTKHPNGKRSNGKIRR